MEQTLVNLVQLKLSINKMLVVRRLNKKIILMLILRILLIIKNNYKYFSQIQIINNRAQYIQII
jgi:hypothetical protein